MARVAQAIDIDRLPSDARTALASALYPIFCESYAELPIETVSEEILFWPNTSLYIVEHDDVSVPVGFFILHRDVVEVEGRKVKVYSPGAYFRRGVKGGAIATKRGWIRLLRDVISSPLEESYLLAQALTPVSYRRLTKAMNEVWPSRAGQTPPEVQAVTNAILEAKGLTRVGQHPSVIRYHDPAFPTDAGRILSHPTLSKDPDVIEYLSLNPDFADGNVLCCLTPLTMRNLVLSTLTNFLSSRD